MGKLKDIKWYEWIFFLLIMYLSLPNLIFSIENIVRKEYFMNPYMPRYTIYLRLLINFFLITTGLFALTGIYFYASKNIAGWILLFSSSLQILLHQIEFIIYSDYIKTSSVTVTILFIAFSVFLLFILIIPVTRKKFTIQWKHFIYSLSLSLPITFIEIFKIKISYLLSELFA
ncbi:MAG TPA: hypothetical protein VNZ49_16015 [Bacteroidia bacterium]|jgi:hypothetical protein|nr:hypothetical protein [Bacteroidia bacterium]